MLAPTRLNELIAINLRYDPSSAALGTRAQAQVVAKLLFVGGKQVSQRAADLAKGGAKALGLSRLSVDAIDQGLAFLAQNKLAKQSENRWLLTERGYETIGFDVERAKRRLEGVLDRHFPGRLDRERLTTWFNEACVAFYGLYGTQWAAAIARRTTPRPLTTIALNAALRDVTDRSELRGEMDSLLQGFHNFINSTDSEDIEHQWSLGQSMLAARLVAANIGPDPITSADFRDSLLLLDTNALIVAALESHRLTRSLAQLGEALTHLGVTLGRIDDTREEYIRAVRGRQDAALAVVGTYSTQVLRSSGDPFIQTALDRHCGSESDFNQFFEGLLDPPSSLPDGTPIEALQEPEIDNLANRGRSDQKLKEEIETVWARLRGRRKTKRATEHDAALTAVAEGLYASGRKCAVLTLDRTMHEHALQRAGQHAPPLWISLDALIQVLAADGSGPGVDPTAYAPLMSSIIRHQCEPVLNTYTTEDLGILLDIEERCAALPEPAVQRIANIVARARLSGRQRSDPELQLQVRRAFQGDRTDEQVVLRDRVRQSDADIRVRDQQLAREVGLRRKARYAFIVTRSREIRRGAAFIAIGKGAAALTGGAALAIGAILATRNLLPVGSPAERVSLFLSLIAPSIATFGFIWNRILPAWRLTASSAESLAADEVDEDTPALPPQP